VSEIDNILATLKRQEVEYDLGTSDFAVTIDDAKNSVVDVQLLQRNFKYESCQIIGNNSIPKNTKGVILFVSKSKYPCFVPFYFGTNYSDNEHNPGETDITAYKNESQEDYPEGTYINLRQYLSKNGLSEGVHYQSHSPDSNQWGTIETINSLGGIIKDFYNYTKGKSLFAVGDISKKGGGTFKPHRGAGHKTGRGADCYTSNQLHIASNQDSNKSQIIALFKIFSKNGVLGIMWQPKKFIFNETPYSNLKAPFCLWDIKHGRHFHVSFKNLPF